MAPRRVAGRGALRLWAALAFAISLVSPVSIYSIQHTSSPGLPDQCYPSPYEGQAVNTSGVVTSVHRDSITMQSDGAEWCGIAVHLRTSHPMLDTVRVGDALNVSATVAEIDGMTVLQNVSGYEILSSGNSITAVIVTSGQLGTACNLAGEALEGVLVSLEKVRVDDSGACDAITIHSQGSGSTKMSLGSGTLLSSITGTSSLNKACSLSRRRRLHYKDLAACEQQQAAQFAIKSTSLSAPTYDTIVDSATCGATFDFASLSAATCGATVDSVSLCASSCVAAVRASFSASTCCSTVPSAALSASSYDTTLLSSPVPSSS
ncbi:MAG: hypothetical protein SGPRY_008794 [Prymnesium sp.]